MISLKLKLFLFLIILINFIRSDDTEEDYDYGDNQLLEDCQYEIGFKTYKKTKTLDLCDSLIKPTLQTRIQLQIYVNHTEEKIHIRAISSSLINSNVNKSLITLTTHIMDEFKYSTSLLIIDDYQFLSLSTLQSIVSSLINIDLNLLGKNLKKTLFVAKGGYKQIFTCSGNFYPKQTIKILNITSTLTKPITCTKEPQDDLFFTLQEKMFLNQVNQKNFHLVDIHQDDQKQISRICWYTCNNPKACNNGLQNKQVLDKTVNYVLKVLQQGRIEKKISSG